MEHFLFGFYRAQFLFIAHVLIALIVGFVGHEHFVIYSVLDSRHEMMTCGTFSAPVPMLVVVIGGFDFVQIVVPRLLFYRRMLLFSSFIIHN